MQDPLEEKLAALGSHYEWDGQLPVVALPPAQPAPTRFDYVVGAMLLVLGLVGAVVLLVVVMLLLLGL